MQQTIKKEFSIEGIGIHSGKYSKVTVKPAPPNTGIKFIISGTEIPATIDFVKDTVHGVSIGKDNKEVKTCEHLLSAFYGLNIHNAICEIEGEEIPTLDGSNLELIKLIEPEIQNTDAEIIEIKAPVFVEKDGAFASIFPYNDFGISFYVEYQHPGILPQTKIFYNITPEVYKNEISSARTYVFLEWIESLIKRGLIKGGSFTNCVIFSNNGPLNGLRFDDEPVRHKILDLIGDIALLGKRINGWFFCSKSGHTLNIELVKKISYGI